MKIDKNPPIKTQWKHISILQFCFPNILSNHKRNSNSLIKCFKEKLEAIDVQNFPKLVTVSDIGAYLAKKILKDSRNWENISSIKSSYFNALNFAEQSPILMHLEEFSSETDQQRFSSIILLSRESEEISLASSNAATILNKIGFSFDDKDFNNIKIPYADLSKNSFLRTDFFNSDLRFTDFTSSVVAFSDLSNCKLDQSKLSKLIFDDKIEVKQISVSKCGKFIVTNNGFRSTYNACLMKVFSVNPPKEINSLDINNRWMEFKISSTDSYNIYILHMNANLQIWNFIQDSSKFYEEKDIEVFDAKISESKIVYLTRKYITIKSLPGLKSLYQIKNSGNKFLENLIWLSEEYLVWKIAKNCHKLKIFSLKSGLTYQKTMGNSFILHNDIYLAICNGELELGKIQIDEPMWKIAKAHHMSISLSADNQYVGSFGKKCLFIFDIQNQYHFKIPILKFNNNQLSTLFQLGFYNQNNSMVKNLRSYNFIKQIDLKQEFSIVHSMIFTENTLTIFLSGSIKVYDCATKRLTKSLEFPCNSTATDFDQSGEYFGFTYGKTIEIWNYQLYQLILKINFDFKFLNFQISYEKNQFSLSHRTRDSFYIFSINSGRIIRSVRLRDEILSYRFIGDFSIFSLVNNSVGIWHQSTNRCEYADAGGKIINIICSPCKRRALLYSEKNEICIFNVVNKLSIIICHEKCEKIDCFNANFSPCGCFLTTARIFDIILWDASNGIKILKMDACFGEIVKICYSLCGKYVASYIDNDLILIWNIEKSLKNYQLKGSIDSANTLNFDKVIVSNVSVFQKNNLFGVSYVDMLVDSLITEISP